MTSGLHAAATLLTLDLDFDLLLPWNRVHTWIRVKVSVHEVTSDMEGLFLNVVYFFTLSYLNQAPQKLVFEFPSKSLVKTEGGLFSVP